MTSCSPEGLIDPENYIIKSKIYVSYRRRISRYLPQNRCSFPFDRATPPALLSFTSHQVLLAVIFCVDSAPDKPNEHQNAVFPK